MTSANQYRVKAAEFAAMAKEQKSPKLQFEYAQLAAAYIKLGDLADRNAMNDVGYETPPEQRPGAT